MILNFLFHNAFAIILFLGTILIGYGYYKSKIEGMMEEHREVRNMVLRIVELEKFQAVQQLTNMHRDEQWKDLVDWLKNLEKKLDEALKR